MSIANPSPPDALVVGAGPVGLTMAAELVRHGMRCRLVDQALSPTDKSKALVLWSRTLELLDDMGAVGRFIETGLRARGFSMYGGGKLLVHLEFEFDSPYGYALMLPQCDTERLLTDHLSSLGVTIERGTILEHFACDDTGVTARLRAADGTVESLRTPWLLGCDGAHSTVRHGLGIDFAGEAEPNDWMLADVHLAGMSSNDVVTVHVHEDGVLVFFPIDRSGRFRVIADIGAAHGGDRAPDPTLEEVQEIVDRRGPGGLKVSRPVWLAGFRINERKVDRYRHGRVMLAGDAAHIHSPAGGQGMNTGMQDAYNLGWKLGLVHRGLAKDVLLDSYSTERSAVGDLVLRQAGLLTKAATLRNPIAQRVRNHLYATLTSLDLVRHRIGSMLSEVAINYRDGDLSSDERHGLSHFFHEIGVGAGDRMPDAPLSCVGKPGAQRVFDVLRGTRHVLLLLAGDGDGDADALAPLAEAVDPRLVSTCLVVSSRAPEPVAWAETVASDATGALARRLGTRPPAAYLVRPDGYVGWCSDQPEASHLKSHLATYLVS